MTITITKLTTIIVEQNPAFFVVRCGHCKGTGQKYPGYSGTQFDRKDQCPTCEGIGLRKLQIPSDWNGSDIGLLKCAHCKGTGQKWPSYGDTEFDRVDPCPTCGGVGALVRKFPRITCPHCKGTGKLFPDLKDDQWDREKPCPTCSGSGSNWIERIK